jgi:NADH:ubiquinone oxidoreductase subunit E
MYGVITFYAQFYTEPHGKHLVRCCRGTACHVRGGKKVITAVRNALGIEDGATTEDMLFSFETVACLGACALSPIMVVDNTYYGNMSTRKAEQILRGIEGKESP